MRSGKILACQAIGLVLSVILLGGCQSKQQASCLQEKLELQKTLEAKDTEINKLKANEEFILKLVLEYSGNLEECKDKLAEMEREKRIAESPKLTPEELKKGLAELKANIKAKAKRMAEKAAAEADKSEPSQGK